MIEKKKQGLLFTFFLCMLSFLLSDSSPALAKWVVAEGSCAVKDENRDVAATKKCALHDAERNAIERAIGAMIESESLVENYILIKDKILTRVEGYVKELEILNENCSSSICEIKIRAEVGSRDLADDIAALARVLPKMNYPSVAIDIGLSGLNQQLLPVEADLSRIVEDELMSLLRKKGFIMVEHETIKMEQKRQSKLFTAMGNELKRAMEENSDDVQIFISGDATVQDAGPSPFNNRIHAYSAVISVRAVEAVTGTVLSSYSVDASAPSHSFVSGARTALFKASHKLGEKIAHDIVKIWLNACYNDHNIKMVVENIPFKLISKLKKAIEKHVSGVSTVLQKNYMRKRAVLIVRWNNCNIQRLAEKISSIRIAKYGVEVLEVEANSLRIGLSND